MVYTRIYMVLGNAVSTLEKCVWILNQFLRSITWSLFTLKASNFSQRDLLCGDVRLSIGYNWKLAPVPCAISGYPFYQQETSPFFSHRKRFRYYEFKPFFFYQHYLVYDSNRDYSLKVSPSHDGIS